MNQKTKPKGKFNPQIAEYFIGLSLLIKGYEELPHFSHYPFSIGFIFFLVPSSFLAPVFITTWKSGFATAGGFFIFWKGRWSS